MKRRDMKLLLEERFERIALLETRIDTMDQLVEGYRAREQAIFDTLSAAKESAAKMMEQAKTEGAQIRAEAEAVLQDAEQVRLSARAEAEALLADAIHTANTLKAEAEKKGIEMTASIKADSERMLRDAEIIKREYEEMVDSFNAMLEQNASELEITAARFGEFVKNRKIDRTEARLDGNAFYKSVGEMSDANLPDASGDPSLLMQNIYRIQNRPLPEDRLETPVQEATQEAGNAIEGTAMKMPEFPMEDGNGADERQVAEPYSEQAWVNEAQQSESEPQAEFTRVYSDDFAKTDYTVQSEECAVTQQDAESAFDEIVSGQEPAGDMAAAAIPLGSAALAAGIAEKPLSDVSRAMDEYFDKAFDPDGKIAQDAVTPDQTEELTASSKAPATPATVTAPEPYSEQAWAQSNFASDHEPQAEGALFADANVYANESMKQAAPAGEPVLASEAESALDDYLAQIGLSTAAPGAPAGVTAPEPYSEQAWAQSATTSEHEPQAEGALFVDTFTFTSESLQTKSPEDVIPSGEPVLAGEAENAFDDYLAQINAYVPTVPSAPVGVTPPEPYSEKAWAQSAAASEYEPQAEGALFGDIEAYLNDSLKQNDPVQAVAPVYEPAVASGEPVSTSEAESEVDDYLAQINAYVPTVPSAPVGATAPEPYSEKAWAQSAAASEYEPQAEGALFGDIDSYLNDSLKQNDGFKASAFVPEAAPTVEAPFAGGEPVSASEAESAFDDYLSQSNSGIPAAPATPTAPEPYSEQAWAQSAAASEYEPQAEGASYLSNIIEEEEEPEPAPPPRRYNEYGEIREWEPEPEPDMGDIPTVSRFMGESGGSDEISLDQLLDEIIKAGE